MSTDLAFPIGREYDMTRETGPAALTLAQFHAMPVGVERLRQRRAIDALEARMRRIDAAAHGLVKIEQEHDLAQPILHWLPGILVREMHLFAGLFVVGKRHAREHLSIISCGRATVMTERGWQVIEGPCQFKSPAGTKRALLIHEDMIWTTVHRTDATTIEAAEADLMLAETPLLEAA